MVLTDSAVDIPPSGFFCHPRPSAIMGCKIAVASRVLRTCLLKHKRYVAGPGIAAKRELTVFESSLATGIKGSKHGGESAKGKRTRRSSRCAAVLSDPESKIDVQQQRERLGSR